MENAEILHQCYSAVESKIRKHGLLDWYEPTYRGSSTKKGRDTSKALRKARKARRRLNRKHQ